MNAMADLRALGAVRCAVCQLALCGHSDGEWLHGYPVTESPRPAGSFPSPAGNSSTPVAHRVELFP